MTPPPRSSGHAALEIVTALRAAGHVALLAGGCVRDMLLGREPKDYDVATDAPPEQVTRIFPKARLVGAKFGVVLVRKFGHDVEVATFRADGPYSDGRHPDTVTYGSEIEDAQRRDFTINALYYDPLEDRVIDHVEGRKDLESRVIRTVGDPRRRFAEDHLRMLRAVRFSARLHFPIETRTAESIREQAASLATISPERIWMELELMLVDAGRADAWRQLGSLGLVPYLAGGWNPSAAVMERIARRLSALPHEAVPATLALALLLQEESPDRVEEIGRALRLSNKLIDTTAWMVGSLPKAMTVDVLELADLKMLMAHPAWNELLEMARVAGVVGTCAEAVHGRLVGRAAAVRPEDVAPPPLLSGDDLSAIGVLPGPRFGEILKAVYRAQLNETIHTAEQAGQMAREFIDKT